MKSGRRRWKEGRRTDSFEESKAKIKNPKNRETKKNGRDQEE